MQKVLVAGANGLIGTRLSEHLSDSGYDVHWLVRRPQANQAWPQHGWDPERGIVDAEALKKVDVLVNLAGSPIAVWPWTDKRKQEIADSRLRSVKVLADALAAGGLAVNHILQASGVGYYGHRGDLRLTETDAPGRQGFLTNVCKQWEEAARQFQPHCERLTILRTGLYLDPRGGVWKKLMPALPLRVLNYFGNGRHYYAWIHHADYHAAILHVLQRRIAGPVNLTAPTPVTHRDMMRAVRGQIPSLLIPGPPAALLRMILGEMSSVVLDSCRAEPQALLATGFRFRYPVIQEAVADLLS
ncbi:MAG: TIGR01777 family protein [Saprospiraceae bacterium]|nr:TIGR01777 family protein [Saprospiraceae bacterium]